MRPFLWKRCFLTWMKKWVLLTVFLKSCVLPYFYSVFSKTQLFNSKICVLTKKNMKNCGLFWTWQNGVFWVCFFEVLMLLWFVFGVSGIVPEVLKMLVLPFWGAFVGWLILVYLGFGRFSCFCVSCVCFCFFLCCFCFCFVCFVFVLLLDCFGVGSCFVFVFLFFLLLFFCFLGGLV